MLSLFFSSSSRTIAEDAHARGCNTVISSEKSIKRARRYRSSFLRLNRGRGAVLVLWSRDVSTPGAVSNGWFDPFREAEWRRFLSKISPVPPSGTGRRLLTHIVTASSFLTRFLRAPRVFHAYGILERGSRR